MLQLYQALHVCSQINPPAFACSHPLVQNGVPGWELWPAKLDAVLQWEKPQQTQGHEFRRLQRLHAPGIYAENALLAGTEISGVFTGHICCCTGPNPGLKSVLGSPERVLGGSERVDSAQKLLTKCATLMAALMPCQQSISPLPQK